MVIRSLSHLRLIGVLGVAPICVVEGQHRVVGAFSVARDSLASFSNPTAFGLATRLSRGPRQPSKPRQRPSRGRYVAIGAAVGATVGLTIGLVSKARSSECTDCITPTSLIPVAGAVAGALVGAVGGLFTYAHHDDDARGARSRSARRAWPRGLSSGGGTAGSAEINVLVMPGQEFRSGAVTRGGG